MKIFTSQGGWSPQLEHIGGVAEFHGGGMKFSFTEFL